MQIVHGRAGRPVEQRGATFTGVVWGDPVLPSTDGTTVNSVTFTPGARTYWHHHERGQLLVVTAGSGWVCPHGEEPQPITVGDVVWVPPGERHWHGAGRDSIMTHLATSLGTTTWLEEVAEAEYAAIDAGGAVK
ncbi:MAG: cupin domain-containing protein [Streptosporangiales bacterium]|nr:cupin domain-containing protein [Streptosporangiales bacterium]